MCVCLFGDAEAATLRLFDAINGIGKYSQMLLQFPRVLVKGAQFSSEFVELPIECGYLLIICP
jgi:hypothetical protein